MGTASGRDVLPDSDASSVDVQGKAPTPPCDRPWRWVPIRSLAPRHRERIATHLLQLAAHDRYLRFGYAASNAQVSKYVDTLDFDRDEVFGVFNRRLALIALSHLAYAPSRSNGSAHQAEFGVSVLECARGRGYGSRLFDHAMLHARNRGVQALFIHALSENRTMLGIATRAGAVVERHVGESEAWLRLPQDTLASQLEQAVVDQIAELDYRFKVQTHAPQEADQSQQKASAHLRAIKENKIKVP